MGSLNWSDILGTVLPTVVILGGGWIRTHGKVKEALDLIRKVVDETDDATKAE